MTSAHLQQWIQHPETLNRDTLYELRTLVARYPYFQSLRLLYLKNLYLLHDINFGAELRTAVLYVADRRVLFYLIEGDRYTLKSRKLSPLSPKEMDEEPSVDRTLSLIDAFLSTVPEENSSNMELDYAMDYTAYLMQDESETESSETSREKNIETPKLRGHELIDGFILKSETANVPLLEVKPLPAEFIESVEEEVIEEEVPTDLLGFSEPVDGTSEVQSELSEIQNETSDEEDDASTIASNEELDDSCFTETLAKIYIKQHRYDKALEIIKKLSLNYPKKNAYFADQIRFLEKLIINAKSK